MPQIIIEISGWLPAAIIPVATALQLISIFKHGSAEGVSGTVWVLFGIANLGLYVYAEKYFEYQAILGLLTPAILDFIIATLAWSNYTSKK